MAGGESKRVQRARPAGRWRRASKRPSRGVSEVIGTILILALTVTLFSAIFFFVNTFPRPPTQASNQFSATLTYMPVTGKGIQITGVRILHLSGPVVFSGGTGIYLFVQAPYTAICPPVGCTIPSGLNGSQIWSLGGTWQMNLSSLKLYAPNNITVTIVSNNQLLFSQNVPGAAVNSPPVFLRVWTYPVSPFSHSTPFYVNVTISDPNLNTTCSNSCVELITSALPGHNTTSILPMTFKSTYWTVKVPVGVAPWIESAGTYNLFILATNILGLQNSLTIAITMT
jgi:flagellin-like protein